MADKKKLVSLLDAVSRTIIGRVSEETEEYIDIENPVVVNIVPLQDHQTGQTKMSLQLFPIFFKEFLADRNQVVTFRYLKKNITLSVNEITFDFRLEAQYEQLFSDIAIPSNPGVQPASVMPQAKPAGSTPDVKLFD